MTSSSKQMLSAYEQAMKELEKLKQINLSRSSCNKNISYKAYRNFETILSSMKRNQFYSAIQQENIDIAE